MNNESVIIVENLTKKFGDFTAVDTISFEVKKGEIFGFLGANGAGKTTAGSVQGVRGHPATTYRYAGDTTATGGVLRQSR